MNEPAASDVRVWRSRLLGYLGGHAADIVADLAGLVRVPSVSGTADENTIQGVLGERLAGDGLEVDAWAIPMAETLAAEDFPGVEVERAEAWDTVGRLPGTGGGASLMLNAHVDVVPPGTWSRGAITCRSPVRRARTRCTGGRRQPRARAPRVGADRRPAHGGPRADPHRTRALRGAVIEKETAGALTRSSARR
jgi:hypothetical protein